MGYIFILASILAENTGKVFDKFNYKHTKIKPMENLFIVFAVMSAAVLAFIAVAQPEIPEVTSSLIIWLSIVVLLSFISNVFDETSLKINNLTLREPLNNFRPILAGAVGYVIFPSERDIALLIALVLGAFVVAWGVNPRNLRRVQRTGIVYMTLAVIVEALLTNAYVFTLDHANPEYIALFRTAFVWILLMILFKPKKRHYKTKKKAMKLAILAGLAYGLGAVVSLYAIDQLGIVTTMLLLLFAPALRYASAFVFLKDKPTNRQVVSSLMLAAIALYAGFVS